MNWLGETVRISSLNAVPLRKNLEQKILWQFSNEDKNKYQIYNDVGISEGLYMSLLEFLCKTGFNAWYAGFDDETLSTWG